MKFSALMQDIFEQGRQEGIKEVIEESIKEGMKQGIKQGIINQVKILKEFNVSEDDIVKRIKKDFGLSEEEAKEYLM